MRVSEYESVSVPGAACGGEGGQRIGFRRDSARWIEERRVVCDEIGSSGAGEEVEVEEGVEVGRRDFVGGGKNTGVYRDSDIAGPQYRIIIQRETTRCCSEQ